MSDPVKMGRACAHLKSIKMHLNLVKQVITQRSQEPLTVSGVYI